MHTPWTCSLCSFYVFRSPVKFTYNSTVNKLPRTPNRRNKPPSSGFFFFSKVLFVFVYKKEDKWPPSTVRNVGRVKYLGWCYKRSDDSLFSRGINDILLCQGRSNKPIPDVMKIVVNALSFLDCKANVKQGVTPIRKKGNRMSCNNFAP